MSQITKNNSAQIVSVRLPQTDMILPSQINALVYANDEQIASQIYIPIIEYIKIKEEKQKLESLVITLQSQLNENIQLRQTMQTEIDNLNKQIIDLNTQLVSLNVMKDEFDKIKLYQKMADSFTPLNI
jgi:superfamily II helicase